MDQVTGGRVADHHANAAGHNKEEPTFRSVGFHQEDQCANNDIDEPDDEKRPTAPQDRCEPETAGGEAELESFAIAPHGIGVH